MEAPEKDCEAIMKKITDADETTSSSEEAGQHLHQTYKWYHINTSMLPAKLAYYLVNSRQLSYEPVLILFLTGIGLSKTESGLIIGCRMIGQLVGGPFWGVVADKWNCHRRVILIMGLLAFLSMCSQPFISTVYGDPETNQCPVPVAVAAAKSNKTIYCNQSLIMSNCTLQNSTLTTPEAVTERFGSLFVIIFLMQVIVAFNEGFMAFIDTATLRKSQLSTHRKVDYGPQRMYGALGAMTGVTITNTVIDHFPFQGVTCHAGLFIPFGVFTILTAIALMFLYKDLDFKAIHHKKEAQRHDDKKSFWTLLLNILRDRRMAFFFFITLISGMGDAAVRFNYLYLKDLNAPRAVYSLTIVVGASTAFVGFFVSHRLIELIGGTWRAFAFSFASYGFRYLGYSLLVNPWFMLLCESMHVFSFCLFLSNGVTYIKERNNHSGAVLTTLVSLFNAVKFGVGPLIGSSLTGYLYEEYGPVITFRSLAIMEFVGAVAVAVLAVLVLERKTIVDDGSHSLPESSTLMVGIKLDEKC